MKAQLEKWHCPATSFNKAKTKDEKKCILIEAWFQKFQVPQLAGLAAPMDGVLLTKQEQIAAARSFKADVAAEPISPEIEELAKILCFQEQFLSAILSGSKTLECRKSSLTKTSETWRSFFPKAPAKGFSLSTAAYFIFLNLFLLLHLPHSLFLTLFLLLHLPHSLFLTLFILLHLPYFIFFTNFLLLHPHNIII